MSIDKRRLKNGNTTWSVRWLDPDGRHRRKHFARRADADAFDLQLKRLRQVDGLAMVDSQHQTLESFAGDWLQLHGLPNLDEAILRSYAGLWATYVSPGLGHYSLGRLVAQQDLVVAFAARLRMSDVGDATTRRVLVILQGVLQRAVEWQRIPTNPARCVRKPTAQRKSAVRPLTPVAIEAMRSHLLDERDLLAATLVSVLAYAGLRPSEALGLQWRHVRDRSMLVEQANVGGTIKRTKTEAIRAVDLLGPLATDLRTWKLASSHAGPEDFVFAAAKRGGPWSNSMLCNWRARAFQPAAQTAGIGTILRTGEPASPQRSWRASHGVDPGPRPYDLRHSFCSLLIYEGRNVVEVAQQMGHSPHVTFSTYAHVFAEFDPGHRVTALERIVDARVARRRIAA